MVAPPPRPVCEVSLSPPPPARPFWCETCTPWVSSRMKQLGHFLFAFFWKLGGPGLLLLGILDSSFLFAPLGNDLLGVAMTARAGTVGAMLYYAAMSTAGSVLGCLLVDVIFRKAGEKGLEKHLSKKRLAYVKRKVEKNAVWALILA